MILELRRVGITATGITMWGAYMGRIFSREAVKSVVFRQSRPKEELAVTIRELHARLIK